MSKVLSMTETFRQCQANDIGISRRMLRDLAESGEIPAFRHGNRLMINWDGLMRYLETCSIKSDAPQTTCGIRKISE